MKTLRFIALVCTALVMGLTLIHVLQAPGSKGLDGDTRVTVISALQRHSPAPLTFKDGRRTALTDAGRALAVAAIDVGATC